jgi:hypothetical protein
VTNMEKAVKELQDNLLVLGEIERRQSALLREHSELIVANERHIAKLDAESAEFRRARNKTSWKLPTSLTASSVTWTACTGRRVRNFYAQHCGRYISQRSSRENYW